MWTIYLKKLVKKIGYFYRISRHISINTKVTLYNSIILPHFTYCSSVIYVSQVNYCRLQILQNKAMRIILGVNRYTNINIMLEVLGWLDIKKNMYIQTMLFVYKILNKMVPEYLSSRVVSVSAVHSYNTRNKNNSYVNNTTKALTYNSLFHKGIIEYNSLPNDLKTVNKIGLFKSKLIKYVKERM